MVFKMSNGDEVIASVDTAVSDQVTLVSKPRIIVFNGERGAFLPYFISNPDIENVILEAAHIVASGRPTKELEKSYLEMTTKIQLLG
jgi:hypothetical protein